MSGKTTFAVLAASAVVIAGGCGGASTTEAPGPGQPDDGGLPMCGDGVISSAIDDSGILELCDGSQLGTATCVTLGFTGGTLKCDSSCKKYDTSGCTKQACGNGALDTGEECDGAKLGTSTCNSLGFDTGALKCNSNCKFNTDACVKHSCGNTILDPGEDCEAGNLAGKSCISLGQGFTGGALGCKSNCTFDTSACTTCGDNVKAGAEVCDGSDLAGVSCTTSGYLGGVVKCAADCAAFEVSECSNCGNHSVDLNPKIKREDCDTLDLGGASCSSLGLGFNGGTLACNEDCTFNTKGCTACGDGAKNGIELCDGSDLSGATCASMGQGFNAGQLKCRPDCLALDTSDCSKCGNGVLETSEDCDGTALNHQSCVSLGQGFTGGVLSCNSNCTMNTTQCIKQTDVYIVVFQSDCCSGEGHAPLHLDAGYQKVWLMAACFDDNGWLKLNTTQIASDSSGCSGCSIDLNQDVTSLVHVGDNDLDGYAANDCGLGASVNASFRILW
jgi:hypothetical protein